MGAEQSNLGKEITTLQPTQKSAKGAKTNGLIDKIFNSIKSCGVAASVAVVAVAGATTVAPAPKAQFVHLAVESTQIEYVLSVEELNLQNQYAVVLSTSGEDVATIPIEEDGLHENSIEGLKPEWQYTLSFVQTDEMLGRKVLLKETFQTKRNVTPEPPPEPTLVFAVDNVEAVGLDQVKVLFHHQDLDETCTPEFVVGYPDGTQQTIALSARDLANGYAQTTLEQSATSISVTPVVNFSTGEEPLQLEPFNFQPEQLLDADVVVNTNYQMLTIYLKGMTNGATRVQISDQNTGEIVYNEYLFGSNLTYYYDTSDEVANFAVCLCSEEGEKVSNDVQFSFNPQFSHSATYTFNYKNPGDVEVTQNDDGTINVTIQTDFQSDDSSVYYQVALGDYRFVSQDATFVAEGLPNETYVLIYHVLVDVDGVTYSLHYVAPSGTVNE
ncbi:MAG: hypothetical protein IJD18_00250 [Clostridia bacterium]|nr:hypothetical protein [Clostridia bacterium]